MSGRLEGKRALVTGGGRGIGRAIALAYAGEGARVLVTARSSDQLDEVVTEATSAELAGSIEAITCDLGDPASIDAMVASVNGSTGGIDVLVNNAGIYAAGRFLDIEPDRYTELFEINVVAAVRLAQAFIPGMIDRGRGSVVNIASTAGLFESPGQAPYNTTKHAMVGLTRCIALEMAPTGVTCNAICPGLVDTLMIDGFAKKVGAEGDALRATLAARHPMGRMLDPAEVADLAIYLGCDESRGMTGQAIVISNGTRMH